MNGKTTFIIHDCRDHSTWFAHVDNGHADGVRKAYERGRRECAHLEIQGTVTGVNLEPGYEVCDLKDKLRFDNGHECLDFVEHAEFCELHACTCWVAELYAALGMKWMPEMVIS